MRIHLPLHRLAPRTATKTKLLNLVQRKRNGADDNKYV